jgi:hypothetical protein
MLCVESEWGVPAVRRKCEIAYVRTVHRKSPPRDFLRARRSQPIRQLVHEHLLLDYSARITCSLGSSLTRKAERNPSEMKSNPKSRGVRGSLLPWRATQRGVETRPEPGCGRIGAAWPETGWHGAPPFRNPPRKRLLGGSAFDRTRLDAGSASRGAGTPFNRSSDENSRGNCFRAVGRGRLGERPSGRLCRSVHLGGPVCGSSRGLVGWFPADLGSCKTHLHRAGMGQDCWKKRRCPIRRQQSRHGDPSLGSRRKTGETKSRLRSHDRHSDSETGRLAHRAGSSHRSPAAIPLSSCLTLFCGCRY